MGDLAKLLILLAFSIGGLGFSVEHSLLLVGFAYFVTENVLGE